MKKNSKLIFYSLAIIVIVYLLIAWYKSLWPFQEEEYQAWAKKGVSDKKSYTQIAADLAQSAGKDMNTQKSGCSSITNPVKCARCKDDCAKCSAAQLKLSQDCINKGYKTCSTGGTTCNCAC